MKPFSSATDINRQESPLVLVTVPSSLGWIALVGTGGVLKQLTFGHGSSQAAVTALDPKLLENALRGTWNLGTGNLGTGNVDLLGRLQAYASGKPVDFRDVKIDTRPLTDFQRRVVRHCRRIPYGETLSYGQLAAKAGSSRAARAVGNCMAANRFPLVVPCHRVIPADGRPGAFSAPGGTRTKQRLLALEASNRFA